MKIRRIMSLFLMCMVWMSFSIDLIKAATEDEIDSKFLIKYSNYTVEYSITDKWEDNYMVEVVLTNTSEETLYNWALRFELNDNINEIWGGNIYSKNNNIYTIRCCDYNSFIEPGESVCWKFKAISEGKIEIPNIFKIPVALIEVPIDDYNLQIDRINDFETNIYIENLSEYTIFGWNLEINSDMSVTHCADGIIENSYDNVKIQSYEYNNEIKPHEKICVRLYTEKNDIVNQINDFVLYGREIVEVDKYDNIEFESQIDIEASMNFISSEYNYTNLENEEERIKVKINSVEQMGINDKYDYIGHIEFNHNDERIKVEVSGEMMMHPEGVLGSLYGEMNGKPVAVTINYAFQNQEPYVFLAVGSLGTNDDYYKVFGKRQETNDVISDEFVEFYAEENESNILNESESLSKADNEDNGIALFANNDYDTLARTASYSTFIKNNSICPLGAISIYSPIKTIVNNNYVFCAKVNTHSSNAQYYLRNYTHMLGTMMHFSATAEIQIYTSSKKVGFTDAYPESAGVLDSSVAISIPFGEYSYFNVINVYLPPSIEKVITSRGDYGKVNGINWIFNAQYPADIVDGNAYTTKQGYAASLTMCNYWNISHTYTMYAKGTIHYKMKTVLGSYNYDSAINVTVSADQTISNVPNSYSNTYK